MKIELYNADCLEKMKDIPDGSVDLILTDPPYGTTACAWDSIIPFEPMWEQLKRITKKNGAIVLFGSQPFTSALVMSNLKMFKYEWVWDKDRPSGFALANKRPMLQHENILVFYQLQPTYNPQKTKGKPSNSQKTKGKPSADGWNKTKDNSSQPKLPPIHKKYTDEKYPKTIIYEKKNGASTYIHPTQKPVALMEYLIKTYTNEGETVLDFACGSGTTGVATKNLNRNCILIEKDEQYFKIAKERIESVPEKLF